MEPTITNIPSKLLVGMKKDMTFRNDKTSELWRSFMARRQEIEHRVNEYYFNVQVYEHKLDWNRVSLDTPIQKWAAVEVEGIRLPEGMDALELQGGWYAVFVHRGPASTFMNTLRFIFETWLPASRYELDHREHFEKLQENYHPQDEKAVEEVWIPIKKISM
ncbi:GyrI-like domain-containing protein [Pontibacillus salicampi]|uniref:GyrI-like domain-containing protein n=1 Tax=Pontibacillus salicampi TaxID=1449801 RepID=A0ABV6LQC6_9BACI